MSDVYLWETYDRLGREALDRRDLNQANEAFRSAVATAEEIGSQDRLVLSLRNLAATLVEQGLVSDSYELLTRTLEVSQEGLGESHSQTIETKRDLAGVCRDLGFLDKSEGLFQMVLSQESQSASPEQVSDTLISLAKLSASKGKAREAAGYYEQVVEVRTRHFGDEHPEVAQALLWLSTALHQSGQGDSAQAPMGVAFGIMEKQFAEEPLHLAQSLLAGAQLMVESGQLEPALSHQKRALDLLTDNLPGEDSKIWDARELIATTLAGLGKVDEAVELLEYCLRNQESIEEHRKGAVLKNLGGLYLTLGQSEKADELYAQAAELLEKTLGPEHPAFLATQEERVQLYHFNGQSKKALEVALSCIRATENRFGAGHPNTAQTYASTALLAFNAEEWLTALELMRAAEKIWQTLRPRPEDVLANCRTNIATCLIHLKKFEEATLALDQAEEAANASLRPVIANLRKQLDVDYSDQQQEAATVEEPETSSNDEKPASEKAESENDLAEPVSEVIPEVPEVVPSSSEQPSVAEADDTGSMAEVIPDVPPIPDLPEMPPVPESTLDLDIDDDDEFALPDIDEFLATDKEAELTEASSASETDPDEAQESNEAEESESDLSDVEQSGPSLEVQGEAEEEHVQAVEVVFPDSEEEVAEEEAPLVEVATVEVEPSEPQPGDEDFEDRRSSPRTPLALNKFFDLKVARPDQDHAEEVRSFLVDLGLGGIRINTESAFPADGEVLLTLPEELLGETTEMKAEVVWQKPLYGASYIQGLAFKELTSVQELLLGKKLKSENGGQRANSRQHFRLYRPFPIMLQAEGEDWMKSYATDLSINGLGTRLATQLGEEESLRIRLELEFELPTVEVEAKVAWSREGENGVSHGLQFSTVGPVEAKTIKRYIDRCLEFSPD